MKKRRLHSTLALLFVVVAAICSGPPHSRADEIRLSHGQTVYVPVYSHIYGGDQERPFYLTAICSIRNTDPNRSITIELVDYYDSEGKMLRSYLKSPVVLKPLATGRYVVKESDKSGGSGAKFIVRWQADAIVNPAIVEGIMIGTKMGQGISFVSRGQVIEEMRR